MIAPKFLDQATSHVDTKSLLGVDWPFQVGRQFLGLQYGLWLAYSTDFGLQYGLFSTDFSVQESRVSLVAFMRFGPKKSVSA